MKKNKKVFMKIEYNYKKEVIEKTPLLHKAYEEIRMFLGIPSHYTVTSFTGNAINFDFEKNEKEHFSIAYLLYCVPIENSRFYIEKVVSTETPYDIVGDAEQVFDFLGNQIDKNNSNLGEFDESLESLFVKKYEKNRSQTSFVKYQMEKEYLFNDAFYKLILKESIRLNLPCLDEDDLFFLVKLFYLNPLNHFDNANAHNRSSRKNHETLIKICNFPDWKDLVEIKNNKITEASKEILKINYQK